MKIRQHRTDVSNNISN